MAGREARAGDVVDAERCDRLVVEAEIKGHEGQAALAGELDEPRAAFEAEDDEAIDQRAADVPGELLVIGGRDQRNAGAGAVAGLADARHDDTGERVVEEVGEGLCRGDADGVDLAGAQQPALRVRPAIAQLFRRRPSHARALPRARSRGGEDVEAAVPCDTPAALATSLQA